MLVCNVYLHNFWKTNLDQDTKIEEIEEIEKLQSKKTKCDNKFSKDINII